MFKALGALMIASIAVGETQRTIRRRQNRLAAVATVAGLDNKDKFESRSLNTPYVVCAVAICGAAVGWILSETTGE